MQRRTSTFNRRIVKVVAPTLHAKAAWGEAATADGFDGNVSGWIRDLIAKHVAQESRRLAYDASKAEALAQRVKELEGENALVRDAYEKARGDHATLSAKYQTLAEKHLKVIARMDAEDAGTLAAGYGLSYAAARLPEFEAFQTKIKVSPGRKRGP